MLVIDTHAHLVTGDRQAYPPAPPGGTVNEADFAEPMTVERLLCEMDANGVEKAVLVQRGSIYGFDSAYVCDSAARFPDRMVAVASIDAASADGEGQVHHWVKERAAAGIRLMELVKGADISWLDSAPAAAVWSAAAELGVPVCVHVFPWNRAEGLTRLTRILGEHRGLQVVVDHFGAIRSDAGPPDHGVDDLLEAVAAQDGAFIKFTTIPLGRLDAAGIDFRAVVARVKDLFGAERMMWGSDVTQSPGSYADLADLGRRAVEQFSAGEQEQILGRTAHAIYGKNWS